MMVSSKDRAYTHIREKMLAGGLQAGAKLSEVTLAKEIGVSRTPVREAMTQLETEGLIEQIPRLGSFVRKLERRELQELYEIRECMEGYAASKAAERISPAQLDELQQLCDHHHALVRQFRDSADEQFAPELVKQWVMTDVAFHMLLVRASGSERVAKILSDFRILTNIVGHNRIRPGRSFLTSFARTWREHARIVRALRRRDAEQARKLL
jgi:DNA-binding GntR family transcriptional regulator